MTQEVAVFEPGPIEVLRPLTYAPMAWETHPIDLAYGSQGWGPFHGPWTPEDFMSPFWGIDATWMQGDNAIWYAPGYANFTVFEDPSIDFAANHSLFASLQAEVQNYAAGFGNTMASGISQDSAPSPIQALRTGKRGRLMEALGIGSNSNG